MHGDDGNCSSAITGTMIWSLAGGPWEFEYREIRKATNNFDEKMKLGQGGYVVVYQGMVVGDHASLLLVLARATYSRWTPRWRAEATAAPGRTKRRLWTGLAVPNLL